MTDAFPAELFESSDSVAVQFPVSRLVIDPERFADDTQEPISSRGMGVIYTRRAQLPVERAAV